MTLHTTTLDVDKLRQLLNFMDGEVISVKELKTYGLTVVGFTVDAKGCQIHLVGHRENLETLHSGNFR